MKNVLFVPANDDSIVTLDVDEDFEDRDGNPYFIAGDILKDDDNMMIGTEMVKTPFRDLFMFVDDAGHMLHKPVNGRVSGKMYAGPIAGDAVLMLMELVTTDEGPDWKIRDMPLGIIRKLTDYLS